MNGYDSMDAAELRAELDDWTQRTLTWADDLAQAIEAQDFWRAVFMCHAYRQARAQMKRLKRMLTVEAA